MINVSPYAPNFRSPLLIAPDNQLEWSTRKPMFLPASPEDKLHTTREGDKLTLLAHKHYNNFKLWWVIYDNNLDVLQGHPLDVPAGVILRIPDYAQIQAELNNGRG